jgi:hypothetical protein
LLLQALQLMFLRRRVLSIEIVGSFVKRLTIIATSLIPHASIGLLAVVKLMLEKYPRAQQLMDNEPTPSGVFRYLSA